MDIKTLFGANVKRLRTAAGLSQEELAMRIKADQAYLSRIESGQMNLTLESVEEVAEALSVSPDELFQAR